MFTRQSQEVRIQVEQLLEQLPGTEQMLTIPGVARVTLADFLAEVGNLQSYKHGQQIIRLAELNLKEKQFWEKER